MNASPCAEMGMAGAQDRPVLCLEHCKTGLQLVDHHSPVTVDVPVILPLILTMVSDAEVRSVPHESIRALPLLPRLYSPRAVA